MAVVDKYVDDNTEAGKLTAAVFVHGDKTIVALATEEVAAGDDDGSIYRLFKNIPSDLIPLKIEIYNDAITSGSDYDLGLYESSVDGVAGAVIDKEVLAAALDMSSASGSGSPKDGLNAVNIADSLKLLYELAGDTLETQSGRGYDIALTANTVGSIAGTITAKAWFVQG